MSKKQPRQTLAGMRKQIAILTSKLRYVQDILGDQYDIQFDSSNERKAAAFRKQSRESEGKPQGTKAALARCARMLDEYAPDCFPANSDGQIHFARAIMESVADEIKAFLVNDAKEK